VVVVVVCGVSLLMEGNESMMKFFHSTARAFFAGCRDGGIAVVLWQCLRILLA
jgi:hypothetical protein